MRDLLQLAQGHALLPISRYFVHPDQLFIQVLFFASLQLFRIEIKDCNLHTFVFSLYTPFACASGTGTKINSMSAGLNQHRIKKLSSNFCECSE